MFILFVYICVGSIQTFLRDKESKRQELLRLLFQEKGGLCLIPLLVILLLLLLLSIPPTPHPPPDT